MSRVEIATQAWGWVADTSGNGLAGQVVTIKNLDGSNATHWDAVTGGTSSTGTITTSADGTIPRFIDAGSYTTTISAVTHRVEASAGDGEILLETVSVANRKINLQGRGVVATDNSASNRVDVRVLDETAWAHDPRFAGGISEASGNNQAAFQAFANAVTRVAGAGSGKGRIAAGNYTITSAITFATKNDATIEGAGGNATRIIAGGNNDLIQVTGTTTRLCLRDLWIGSDVVRTAGARALSIIGAASPTSDSFVLDRITLQNMPGPLYCENLQQSIFRFVKIIMSQALGVTGVCAHFKNCISLRLQDWMVFSSTGGRFPNDTLRLDEDCDTIICRDMELLDAGAMGCRLQLGAGATGPRLVRLDNVYCENTASSGFSIGAGRDVRAQGSEASGCGADGWTISGGTDVHLNNNMSRENTNHGYNVSGGAAIKGFSLIGNSASNNSQGTDNTFSGIEIAANLTKAQIIGNRSGDYVIAPPNRQKYGINISATGTNYLAVQGNVLTDNATASLNNLSVGANNQVNGNVV